MLVDLSGTVCDVTDVYIMTFVYVVDHITYQPPWYSTWCGEFVYVVGDGNAGGGSSGVSVNLPETVRDVSAGDVVEINCVVDGMSK